jgi:hypothetical protein
MPLFRRRDGDLVKDVPAYRRIMPLIMPTRTESTVFFEQRVAVGRALELVGRFNDERAAAGDTRKITLFHLVLWAIVQTLAERPRLNRFVMNHRLYQRRGIWLSYSAKKAFDDESPVFVVKKEFDPGWSFGELVDHVHGDVAEGRSSRPSAVDKELSLLLRMPLFLLKWFVSLARWLDRHNLMPFSMIRTDPMYASMFIANLGSLKLEAAFHHNYEWGTIPIFVTIGRIDGDQMLLRWTFDERIEDGLYCARALERLRERLEAGPEIPRTNENVNAKVHVNDPEARAQQ